MGWRPWKSNGQEVILKSLLEEVTRNIELLREGQLLQTMAWDAAVQTRKTGLLGDAAYAAQIAYDATKGMNGALLAYQQSFKPGSPPLAPGQRETYEEFLTQQRKGLAEKLVTLQKDLARLK